MVRSRVTPPTGPSRRTALAALASLVGSGCAVGPPRADEDPPPLPREFRAAWVATVEHIDWPSRRGLTTAEQRAEMLALLDRAREIGLNAIVLQVRPSADAIYPSAIEPWSEYLTGESGRAPDPPWDPLAEWIDGAHRRGLELHAWFNPYRARHHAARSAPAAGHVANTEPAIVKRYGEQLWMDPGEPRAAERLLAVVADLLARYDVDGVHIDDYFYPYPVNDALGREVAFPDEPARGRYLAGGGTLALADWRRDNVDRLVQLLHREIHRIKPWVRFGISPFGLPRPSLRPPGIEGFSQYDRLYADVERWLHEGWLDYLAPQLYWPIARAAQAFPVLLDAWAAQNRQRRHLWPGLFTSRIGDVPARAYAPDEVLAQIDLVRSRPTAGGHLHFSIAALLQDREGIATRLREGPYAAPALPPATPWLAEAAPLPPQAVLRWHPGGGFDLQVHAEPGAPPLRQAVVWRRDAGARWRWLSLPMADGGATLRLADADELLLVAGMGRSALVGPWMRFAKGPLGWRRLP